MSIALLSIWAAGCLTVAASSASWPELRGNAQLTGWQSTPGTMGAVGLEVARVELGRSAPTLTPVALDENQYLGVGLVGGAALAFTPAGAEAWYSHPAGLNFTALDAAEDLDGDGRTDLLLRAGRPTEPYSAVVLLDAETGALRWRYDVEPMSYSWSLHRDHFLPGNAVKQLVVLMQGYPPDPKFGYIALFEFSAPGGVPQQRWRYDFDAYTCFPSLLRTDLDGDGAKELVVQTHSRMWFLDADTGSLKYFAQWEVTPANVRSYGLVKFTDLDHDGREDFLCIANFAQHHEVLLNRDGKMVKAWHHGWDESVTTGKVATRFPPVPDHDLDGDKRTEVVLSMFNADGMTEWGTRVYDALTGELKLRLPGVIVTACADVDGDGTAELLGNACTEPTGKVLAGAGLWRIRNGALEVAWSDTGATALEGNTCRVSRDGNEYSLHADEQGGILLQRVEPAPPKPEPAFLDVPALVGPTMPLLLAAPLDEVPGCELVAYSEPRLTIYTLRGGYLNRISELVSDSAPVLADLDGDGTAELVLSTVAADATPRVRCISLLNGNTERWSAALPSAPREGLPAPRRAYLKALRLTGKATPDLYAWFGVPMARSLALDGTSGAVLWEAGELPEIERYQGASVNFAAAWDLNADGMEDLLFTNPDYYCVADGRTGSLLLGPAFPPTIFDQPSQGLYTFPAVLQRSSDEPLVCLAGGHYFLAAMTPKAEGKWHLLPQPGESRAALEAFAPGKNGSWRIGFGRQDGRFTCLDATSGAVLSEVVLGATASDTLAWDSDGDGVQEFLCGDSHGVLHRLRIGDDGSLQDKPQPLGRAGLGTPIAADFDGDGTCELVLPSADGVLRLLK